MSDVVLAVILSGVGGLWLGIIFGRYFDWDHQ
jgi:hypothetical protein